MNDRRDRVRLGIDIGGTAVKLALIEGESVELSTSDRYLRPDRETLARAVASAARVFGDRRARVGSIGLCVPGIPGPAGDRIEIAVNLPGLVGWRFDELVEAAGVPGIRPVRVNDALAATHDWATSQQARGRVLGIAMGTGVGMAMLEDGEPVRIIDGGVGHLGQIDVAVGCHKEAPIAPDGGRGGLEAYVGAAAVHAKGGIDAAFAQGEPAAEAIIRAIRICHALYRPDTVVLLGGIGRRLKGKPHIDSGVRDALTSLAVPNWRLGFGTDDHHAARGAARFGCSGVI